MTQEKKSTFGQVLDVLSELKDAAEGLQKLSAGSDWVDKFMTEAGFRSKTEKPDLKVVPDKDGCPSEDVRAGEWEKCINFHDRCPRHIEHRGGGGFPKAGGEGFLPASAPTPPPHWGTGPTFTNPSNYYKRGTRDLNPPYPHQSGDVTALGPETFLSKDGKVISYRGENFYSSEGKPTQYVVDAVSNTLDEIAGGLDSSGLHRTAVKLRLASKLLRKGYVE